MCDKVNLDEIRAIPPQELKEILHSWMEQKEITHQLQKKLRKQLVTDFQKTELSKRLDGLKQKSLFSSKDYVIDTLQAEHLYRKNNHFTLSVFFTETRHPTLLPNFEKESCFKFEKREIQELASLMGLQKNDKVTKRILNIYESSTESLLSILLQELINAYKSTDTRTGATQTENLQQDLSNISIISTKSKSRRSKRKRNRGLVKIKKSKKLKEVSTISQNLALMSNNINIIANKLDDFKQNPSQNESKSIVGHVGTIMNQLNGCINNFESLCQNIKEVNETRNQNYDDWMDDLRNSDNGRRFLRKLQKSFSRVIDEEKSKVQKDYRLKLEREKKKLAKLYRRGALPVEKKKDPSGKFADTVAKDINEIFQSTCTMIRNVEKESEMFEKSLELEMKAKPVKLEKVLSNIEARNRINLNECRQIHSSESHSGTSYNSKSFEKDETDGEN